MLSKYILLVLVWLPTICICFRQGNPLIITEDFVYVMKGTANINSPPVEVYREGNFQSGRLALETLAVHLESFGEYCKHLNKGNTLERLQSIECSRFYDTMHIMFSGSAIKVSVLYPRDKFDHYLGGGSRNWNHSEFSNMEYSYVYLSPSFPHTAKLWSAMNEVMPYVQGNVDYNEDLANIEISEDLLNLASNDSTLKAQLTIMGLHLNTGENSPIFHRSMIEFVQEFSKECANIDNAISKWFMSVAKASYGQTTYDLLPKEELGEIIAKVYNETQIWLDDDLSNIRSKVFLTNGTYYIKHDIPVTYNRPGRIYDIYPIPLISSTNDSTYWPILPSNKAVIFSNFPEAAMFMTNEEYDMCVNNNLNCLISSPFGKYEHICSVAQFFKSYITCSYEEKPGAQPYFKAIRQHIIYSVPHPLNIYAICSDPTIRNQGEQVQIRGRGVIEIYRGCSVTTMEFGLSIFRMDTHTHPSRRNKPDHPIKIIK